MNDIKQLRMAYEERRLNIIDLIEEQEVMFDSMAATINFYSAELCPTFETRCFFEGLAKHYRKIEKNRKEIFDKLVNEEYQSLREEFNRYETNQDKCSNRYLNTLNESNKGERK